MQRREFGWQENVGLLGHELIRAAGRRPDAVRHRLRSQSLALVEARVGPNMHEPRHRPGHAVHRREQRRNREPAGHGVAPQVDRLRKTVRAEHVGAYFIDPWPPSRSTEKSWPHFRPPPVDFCSSRLAIGAATERARRLAMPAGTRAKPYKRDSSGVAPASPQVAKSGA